MTSWTTLAAALLCAQWGSPVSGRGLPLCSISSANWRIRFAVEARIGHTFKANLSMADIIAAADRAGEPVAASDWAA